MKTKLLLLTLIMTVYGYAQTYDTNTYFISEMVVSPPNSSTAFINDSDNAAMQVYQTDGDETIEYFEFRGAPNATIEDDVYFIAIDGDGDDSDIGANIGKVRDAINLSGLTFGSNGILVIVCDVTMNTGTGAVDLLGADISGTKFINPFAAGLATSDANVITVQLFADDIEWTDERNAANTGSSPDGTNETLNKFNLDSGLTSPSIGYDGTFNDQSATYMIVKSTAGNPKNEIVDTNEDGVLDGAALAWTIYDDLSILDDDDDNAGAGEIGEFGYGRIIFYEDMNPNPAVLTYNAALSPTLVPLNQYPQYVARQGLSKGYAVTVDATNNDDWIAGRINSVSYPDWKFSGTGTRNFPTAQLTNNNLSDFGGLTLGEVNVDFNVPALSTEDFLAQGLSIYPNPASTSITIKSSKVNIASVELYNILGLKVLVTDNLVNDAINVSNISKGVYLLKVNADNASSVTKRVIIE